jgi:hypothetical protein
MRFAIVGWQVIFAEWRSDLPASTQSLDQSDGGGQALALHLG